MTPFLLCCLVLAGPHLAAAEEPQRCDTDDAQEASVSLLQSSFDVGQAAEVPQLGRKVEPSPVEEQMCTLQMLPLASHPAPRDFGDFDHGSDYEGLYVNSKTNFAFCLIEKNACTLWSTIFNKLESGDLNAGPAYGLAHSTFSAAAAMKVFQDNSATRAVFVRDPLERFLSAFLDKCRDSCSNPFCQMRTLEQKGYAIPFSQAIEWLKTINTSSTEGHFRSQSRHCELNSRLHEYTILHVMEKQTLAINAACLLERAGLSYLDVESSAAINKHPMTSDPSETTEYLKSFYTQESAETVYNAYNEDYALFKLPRPSWIEHAHGKFFSDAGSTKCDLQLGEVGAKNEHGGLSDLSGEIDDIVLLARRAGFTL